MNDNVKAIFLFFILLSIFAVLTVKVVNDMLLLKQAKDKLAHIEDVLRSYGLAINNTDNLLDELIAIQNILEDSKKIIPELKQIQEELRKIKEILTNTSIQYVVNRDKYTYHYVYIYY